MASQDLTLYSLEGFAAQLGDKPAYLACPHYTSSPAGMAWLQKTGHPPPRDACMSRGDMQASVADAAALVREL